MRIGLRILALVVWLVWLWLNALGCGSFARCRSFNLLTWSVADLATLLILPGICVAFVFLVTRKRQ